MEVSSRCMRAYKTPEAGRTDSCVEANLRLKKKGKFASVDTHICEKNKPVAGRVREKEQNHRGEGTNCFKCLETEKKEGEDRRREKRQGKLDLWRVSSEAGLNPPLQREEQRLSRSLSLFLSLSLRQRPRLVFSRERSLSSKQWSSP